MSTVNDDSKSQTEEDKDKVEEGKKDEKEQEELEEDEELTPEEFQRQINEASRDQLRFMLKAHGLPTTGLKAVLKERLEKHLAEKKKDDSNKDEKKKPYGAQEWRMEKLAEKEKELNDLKQKLESKEHQEKKIREQKNQFKRDYDKVLKEKQKAMEEAGLSPVVSLKGTEDFRKALSQKKVEKIKKELADTDGEESVKEGDGEDDVESEGFSSSFSVFNKGPREKIKYRLMKAKSFGTKVKMKNSKDKEVLKDAKTRIFSAQEYFQKHADDCKDITEEEIEELEDLDDELDDLATHQGEDNEDE